MYLNAPITYDQSSETIKRVHFQPDFADGRNKTLPGPSYQSHLSGCHHLHNTRPTAGRDSVNYLELTVMAGKTALVRWAESLYV